MAWKDIVKSVKSGTDTMASVGKDNYQDNYVTAVWKDAAKSIKSGADAVASVAKGSVSNKNSVIHSSLNDIDISVDGDAGKDFAHASPVSSENHSATISEAFVNAIGDMMKDKAVNAVDSVKEHVGRVVDFAPEEPANDSDSGYDLG